MNKYNINKGIGRTVEFKGLKAQYLFIFAGGLLGILVLVMILYIAGISSFGCIGLGVGGASLLVGQTFALNRKHGEHGLMKLAARKRHPKYITSGRKPGRFIRSNLKKEQP
ncbi:DUF4133 domain-containing protein [Flavobacterium coralii]|uniref:DUF4133 domain-containing protein n=1 Tax=Flavobacterium coralii TaxID=2838017 RepID=UPI000C67AD3A|nr:conjugal transfer protein TraF [Flavobacterium sp.]|tara:strand:- start:17621 stop:17953 length:333 start_codon:yes stop_codon:yes gene_type:complete